MSNPITTLDYAPHAARRWPRRWVLIALLAALLGGAANLCWAKFGGPLKRHIGMMQMQSAIAAGVVVPSVQLTISGDACGLMANATPATDPAVRALVFEVDRFVRQAGVPMSGTLAWAGTMTVDGRDRIVVVRVAPGIVSFQTNFAEPASLYVLVIEPGSFFQLARPVGRVQIIPLSQALPGATVGTPRLEEGLLVLPTDDAGTTYRLRLLQSDRLLLETR